MFSETILHYFFDELYVVPCTLSRIAGNEGREGAISHWKGAGWENHEGRNVSTSSRATRGRGRGFRRDGGEGSAVRIILGVGKF